MLTRARSLLASNRDVSLLVERAKKLAHRPRRPRGKQGGGPGESPDAGTEDGTTQGGDYHHTNEGITAPTQINNGTSPTSSR